MQKKSKHAQKKRIRKENKLEKICDKFGVDKKLAFEILQEIEESVSHTSKE